MIHNRVGILRRHRALANYAGLLVVVLYASNVHAVTVTFQQGVSGYTGTVDTFLHAGSPTADNSAAATLVCDGPPPAADERQILLRFDNIIGNGAGQIPAGATINSATLTVNITNPSATGASLHRMLQTWAATNHWNTWVSGIQANGVEAASTADVSSLYNGSTPALFNIDVTTSVAAWAAGASNFGWAWLNNGDDSWQFDSAEGATSTNRPKLSVTYNEGGGSANLVRQPYLQLGTPTSMTVVWRTDVATDSRVRYGTTQGSLTSSASNATVSVDHIVTINGLSPATKYFYDIGSTTASYGGGTATHYFKTSPNTGSTGAFRFWAIGDSGTGSSTQTAVMNAMLADAGATLPDFAIHLGDIAYNSGTDQEFTSNHFVPFNAVLRNTVMWPSLGNHEAASVNTSLQTGPYYAAHVLPTAGQAGGIASGTEAYYSFDYGNAHFVVLDSQDSSRAVGGPMLTWLTNDLNATTQQWLIAYWHHPPYSKGTHDSDSEGQLVEMRERALPILEAAGVDLVLSGHSHAYERSYLIDRAYGFGTSPNFPTPSFAFLNGNGRILDDGNGRPAPGGTGEYEKPSGLNAHEGTVYIVAGHGAQSAGGSLNHPVMYFSEAIHGSCLIDISNNELTLRNIRQTGTVSDTFKILKGDVPPRIASTAPVRSAVLSMLPTVAITFSRPVSGVTAGGLTVNGSAATSVSGSGAGPYTFSGYAAPGNGSISVSLAAGSIADSGPPGLPFEGDSWSYTIDTTPPHLTAESPPRSSTVAILSSISVTFSKPVNGVVAGNLTVNGSPATALSGVNGSVGPYVFSGYATPAEGAVSVILAPGAIVEANGTSQPFAGDSWSYVFHATLVINEFLASNNSGNTDEFGDFDDWLEIYNPGSSAVDMGGMFLTDDLDAPQQYQIPAGVSIPAGGYLIFWCDTTPGQGPLHTNFNISRTGEDLGLFDKISNGNGLIDGFTFTTQTSDITSGRFPNGSGPIVVLSSRTPGATNGGPPPAAPQLPIVIGDTWKYFKGTAAPPSGWNQVSFDDQSWLSGPTGIGYADGDDATPLGDMQFISGTQAGYASVFARRVFSVPNPAAVTSLTFTIDYDDGYVAYLNGAEVARSASMVGTGSPPAFGTVATAGHEASAGQSGNPPEVVNLNAFIGQLVAGNNVLAIQCHNNALDSSDLSLLPALASTTVQCSGDGECSDSNPCTIDTCNSGTCVHSPVTCSQGQTCNQTNGQCEAAPTTVTFQDGVASYAGTQDTYMDQAAAATVRGALDTWRWDTEDPSPNQEYGLIRFDSLFGGGPGQIPPGSQISSATLALVVFNDGVTPPGTVHEVLVDWAEATTTWNNFGGDAGAQSDEYGATTIANAPIALGTSNLNVTSSLQSWSANPSANRGWIFVPQNLDGVQVRSSEYATVAERPKLTVIYTPPVTGCTIDADCNDNNACTTDTCNAGTCVHTAISCDDGNACTDDACDSINGCTHTPHNCDDGNPCTTDTCNPLTGCAHALVNCSAGQSCNSSNGQCQTAAALPIAIGDTWKYFKGSVAPPANWATIAFDESTWPLSGPSGFGYSDGDDNTILNDMLNSYGSVFIRKRFTVTNPAAITSLTLTVDYDDGYVAYINGVEVKRSTGMVGTPPAFNYLAPTSHEASHGDSGPQPPEVSNPPTSLLVAGVNVIAIQGHNNTLASTDFSLIPSLTATFQCLTGPDCSDGNACTDDTCDAGACVHTTHSCDDNDACTTDSCNPATGCVHTAITCNDGNPCTADTCSPQLGCQFTSVSDGTACPDGNLCNGNETCQAGACTPGTPPTCDDNNPCTTDSCNPVSGCQHANVANGTPCPNGTICDGAETCQSGACAAGSPLACNDGLFCNGVESCDSQTGCHVGSPPCQAGEQCDESADRCRQPRMTCQLGTSQTTANTTVPLDVFLEDTMNVRGYQTTISITRTQGSGTVSVVCPGGVTINQSRSDYIFFGLGTNFPATNCTNRRAASALQSGSATVNTSAYLATYALTVSPDATPGSTFEVSIQTSPGSALTNASNVAIPFAVAPACTLTITPSTTGTVTVNLDVPGLRGGLATLDGQNVAQRNVEFVVTTCPGSADSRTLPVMFKKQGESGVAQVVLTDLNPAAHWLAVREGHTLRKRVSIDLSGDLQDTVAVSLKSGDLQTAAVPQDDLIDITDFAILSSRWGLPVSDCGGGNAQDCSLGADTTGDGVQETADFNAIQLNFFEPGDTVDGCPQILIGGKPTGKVFRPVAELDTRVANVAAADVNGDSIIDAADIRAFARQHRLQLLPAFEAKLQRLERAKVAPTEVLPTGER